MSLAPNNPQARVLLGSVHYDLGRYPDAAREAREALARQPDNQVAKALLRYAEQRLAGIKAPKLPQAPPKDGGALDREAEGVGPAADAGTALAAAVQADGPPQEAVETRALLRESAQKLKLGDLDAAQAALERALAKDPGSAEAFAQRAQLRIERKDFARAVADADRAKELGLAPAASLDLKARAHLAGGDPAAAKVDAEAAIRADPMSAAGYRNRALACARLGEAPAGVLADLKRAADLEPAFRAEYEQTLARSGSPDMPGGPPLGAAAGPVALQHLFLRAGLLLVGLAAVVFGLRGVLARQRETEPSRTPVP